MGEFPSHSSLPLRLSLTSRLFLRLHRFRQLIEGRSIDILQPDVMWMGGMTEREFLSAEFGAESLARFR